MTRDEKILYGFSGRARFFLQIDTLELVCWGDFIKSYYCSLSICVVNGIFLLDTCGIFV